MLRTLVRDKNTLVTGASDWLPRMQKSLDQMNVRVHRAVSDIDGVTGMAIMRAIVAGVRDPRQLAKLRNGRCHKSEEEIAEQLSGHWRQDHDLVRSGKGLLIQDKVCVRLRLWSISLGQGLKMYDVIQEQIAE